MLQDMSFLPKKVLDSIIDESTPIVPGECRVAIKRDGDNFYFSVYRYESMNLDDITDIDDKECLYFLHLDMEQGWNEFYSWVKDVAGNKNIKFFIDVVLFFDPYGYENNY